MDISFKASLKSLASIDSYPCLVEIFFNSSASKAFGSLGILKVTIFLNSFAQGSVAASSPLGPFTISSSTTKVNTRARARFAAVQIENESLDESWRYGTFRFDVRVDGRR